jgi:hypothetical protein
MIWLALDIINFVTYFHKLKLTSKTRSNKILLTNQFGAAFDRNKILQARKSCVGGGISTFDIL